MTLNETEDLPAIALIFSILIPKLFQFQETAIVVRITQPNLHSQLHSLKPIGTECRMVIITDVH